MPIDNRFFVKSGLDNNSATIINVADPVNAQDAATKNFAANASNIAAGTLAAARLPAFSGDATSSAGTSTLTLANSGVTAGVYGSTTTVAKVTVDSKGRITLASSEAIAFPVTSIVSGTGISISGGTGNVTVNNNGVLSFSGGTTGLTPSTATNGAVVLGGILGVANGGTGVNTSTGTGSVVLNTSPSLITPTVGGLGMLFSGSTSGTARLIAQAVAGTPTISLPTSTGTLALTSDVGSGTLTLAVSGVGLSGSAAFNANQSTNNTFTVTSNATNLNTASTIVARDASGNFSAGTISAALSGNASTASSLATARNISATGDASWSVSFNGSADASSTLTLANSGVTAGSYGSSTNSVAITVDAKGRLTSASSVAISLPTSAITSGTFDNARISQASVTQHQAALSIAESQIAAGTILARIADNETISGTWSFSNTISGSISGNAATATALQNPRTISATGDATWSVTFDGSANATNTLTLASTGVTPSSYGGTGSIPIISVDAKGRVTSASNGIPSGTWSINISGAAPAASLSGTQLSSGVTSSSLTSVGTLTSLNVSGNTTVNGNIIKSIAASVQALGSTQATAAPITKDINVVIAAGNLNGLILQTPTAGMTSIVINATGANLYVYPAVNGKIDAGAVNVPFALPPHARIMFIATSATQWYTLNATYA